MKYLLLGIFGLIFGSFITMLSYRMADGYDDAINKKSKIKHNYSGRSRCTICGHKLGILDLIPLLSWLINAGKCRYCKKNISLRYPLTEIATSIAFLGLAGYWEDKELLLLFSAMIVALITMIVIDFEHMIIPDKIQIILAIIAICLIFYSDNTLSMAIMTSILCLFIALLLKYGFLYFTKRDGLGLGDVKFFAVAGLYLPIDSLAAFFLISGIGGIIIASIWKLLKKGEKFPFGPALAISLYLCVVFPEIPITLDSFTRNIL